MSTYRDLMREAIIETARTLFLEKTISKVYISDIAKQAGIGEATIYRYFKKKQNLALEVALKEWKTIASNFYNDKKQNGYMRLCAFYNMFLETFHKHRNFFAFLDEFDQIILTDDSLDLSDYQKGLYTIKSLYDEAYEEGIMDNSISEIENKDLFYYTTTHALLSLCKKLATENLIDKDLGFKRDEEVKLLISLITKKIKGEKQ